MRLCSYVVARDYGFAPNPFYGFCTLATCKPDLRKSSAVGDWIIGTGPKAKDRAGYLVYAMCVTETMSFHAYWNDPRFREKRPDLRSSIKKAFGDSIYHRDENINEWCQLDSHHSLEDGIPNQDNVLNDTKVDRVLVSNDFIYWGGGGPRLPEFQGVDLCFGRGRKCDFPQEAVAEFIAWIRSFDDKGYCGAPLEWSNR